MNTIIKGAALVIGGAACIFSTALSFSAYKELKAFNESLDRMSENIDVDIPDKMINAAVEKAAEATAKKEAEKVSETAKAVISAAVNKEVEQVKTDLSDKVKKELERKISMIEVTDIKKKVVSEVSQMIFQDVMRNGIFRGNHDSTVSIIESCTKAGMDSWEIERILKNINS